MQLWIRKQGSMGDDPPFLAVGTEVSAKYKGAFCEAKVRKVVRSVKCKVTFKQGLGTAILTDDQIRGTLRVGAVCEVKHPEKKEFIEATITKIQDCSQYTVVFDDGDITTLRRSALCLKSGRHFAESETLDQLPLTHPEHFSNPVIGGRKGRRSRQTHEDSSDEEDSPKKGKKKEEKEADAGKVVCVELGDKKKQKDNWFPGLVVAPTAQDTVRIRVRDDYLVRSFKDGRYYTVPKKEANEFTREIGSKVDNNTLKAAVEKALLYLDRNELPPHWDRDLLFGINDTSCHSESEGGMDSDSSDDEPREEKDHFVAQLYKFMDDRGTPINKGPTICSRDVDLYKLFKVVHKLGGYNRVTNHNQWKTISHKMGFGSSSITNLVKQAYKKFLHSFEDFYRKLGCTMVNHPRGNRTLHRSSRSLIRDRDRATPINTQKDKDKEKASTSASTPTTSSEKPNENTGKNAVQAEKKEEVKASEEKKEKEPMSKMKEQSAKAKEQPSKGKDATPKTKDATPKTKEQTPKAKESVSKVKDTVSRSKEQVAKTKESSPKTKEITPKTKEPASKAKESASKAKEPVSKTKEPISKTKEPVSKAKEPVSKTRETVLKTKEQATKAKDTPSKAKDTKEQVTKTKDTPLKVKDPVPKTKSKGKEKKEQIKEEPIEEENIKVKEEPVEVAIEVHEIIEIKEEKPVCEVKEEKIKDKEVEEVIEIVTSDECEVTVVAEVKNTSRPKDVKVTKEECIEISDIDKLEEKIVIEMSVYDKKVKEEPVNNIDENEENEISDDLKKKVEKKSEDEDKVLLQNTRSKSKEDLRCKKESASPLQEGQLTEKDAEKSCPPRPVRKEEDSTLLIKKRGRKRKDIDDKGKIGETMGQLASHIIVGVGDKLQVYYGPTHESKVTYEAKVLDIEEDSSERMYLVHYLGWNTRYDEWIKRGRIADNLSWTPSRAKRLRQQHAQLKKPMHGKRGRPSLSGRSQENTCTQQTPRSTTPSSVTSSSSRTKSPAQRLGTSPRITRNTGDVTPTGLEFRRRTRRMSGHTDTSLPSETESDDEYESEPEVEEQTKDKLEKNVEITEKDDTLIQGGGDENKRSELPIRKKVTKRKDINVISIPSFEDDDDDEEEDEEDDDEEEEDEEEEEEEDDGEVQQVVLEDLVEVEEVGVKEDSIDQLHTPPSGEKRRSKRCRKLLGLSPDKDLDEKREPNKQEAGTESEEEQPKGRDFDLNQIRSELKGIEKTVKLSVDLPHPLTSQDGDIDEVLILDDSSDLVVDKSEVDEEIVVLEEKIVAEKVSEKESTEDVYEFKEPEPFEFEVRTKRESLLSDDRGCKMPRRPIARLFDIEPKVESKGRKRLVRSPLKTEAKESPPFEGDKKRFKRSSNKKSEEDLESEKVVVEILHDIETSSCALISSEPTTPQKNRPLSACEEAFDKLCESPSFHVTTKSVPSPSAPSVLVSEPEPESKTPELEQLSLLHDDGDDDDNEDRLIISETDDMETGIEEPLFSYPQRDHEELFPTLVSSEPSVSSIEPSCPEPSNDKSREPPLLSQINVDLFTSFGTGLDSSGAEKNEVCKTPVKTDGIVEGTDCGAELSSTSHVNVDVMNLYSMDDDFEDDPINAAIRRVMSQNMMDEDTNDMDIFGGKPGLCSSFKQDIKPNSESPLPETIDILSGRKRRVNKKSVLSQEFVESDSDSSDEEERLVIAKVDEESQPDDVSNSSSVLSMKLPVTEASEFDPKTFEVSIPLNEPDEQNKETEESDLSEIVIHLPEEEEEEEEEKDILEENEGKKDEELISKDDDSIKLTLALEPDKSCIESIEEQPLVIPVIVDMELGDNPKKPDPDPDPGPEPPVIILEAPLPEVKDSKDIMVLEEPVLTTVGEQCEEVKIEMKSEEESEVLGSLLCEETIPGSPTQVPEPCSDDTVEDEKVLLLEMPFASVPGSNCDPSGTVVPTSVPVSLPEPLPPVQSPILPVPLHITSSPPPVQPSSPGVSKRNSNEAAPVMDNTPPTTPDSTLSTISGSPREEHGDMSPTLDNESTKSHRDSFEIDMDSCAEGTKVDHFSEDDSFLNVEVSNSCDNRLQGLKLLPKKPCIDLEKEMESSPKKRRRSRKRSECESSKRLRHSSGRSARNLGGAGSDSDDTSENSATGCMPMTSSENTLSSRSPRPSKYNFYVELAPELDGSQRIALLQQKLQELRKTYMNVKAELACIDRRRKKLRRREREVEKATKQEVACS